jgi:peptide/nickel transport system permease protein
VFRYLARRLLWAIVLMFAVTLVTYVIFFMVPANPARQAAGQAATPERVAEVEERLGLNDPVYVQYGKFMKELVLERSLGHSFVDRRNTHCQSCDLKI